MGQHTRDTMEAMNSGHSMNTPPKRMSRRVLFSTVTMAIVAISVAIWIAGRGCSGEWQKTWVSDGPVRESRSQAIDALGDLGEVSEFTFNEVGDGYQVESYRKCN